MGNNAIVGDIVGGGAMGISAAGSGAVGNGATIGGAMGNGAVGRSSQVGLRGSLCNCPCCGAPIDLLTGDGRGRCAYCGSTTVFVWDKVIPADLEWTSSEGFVIKGDVLLEYSGEDKRVRVPDGVRVIGEEAFSGADIESIVLPPSLVEIEDYAFEDCSWLKSIVIPEGVWLLGYGAFDGCDSLRVVTLPTSFQSIDDIGFAFVDCWALERLNCGIDFSDCDDSDLSLAFAWGSPILGSIRRSLGRCVSCGDDVEPGFETCEFCA